MTSKARVQAPPFRMETRDEDLANVSGWVFLPLWLGLFAYAASVLMKADTRAPFMNPFWPVLWLLGLVYLLKGIKILQPNQALVGTFFGSYAGTLDQSGFFYVNPLLSTTKVSTKSHNHITPVMKVNDGKGNPVEIAAAIVWHVDSPAASVFDVESLEDYVKAQSEGALREMAGRHPYDAEGGETCLRRSSEALAEELRESLQDRLVRAGVQVDEARINHLAYAPEIAQAMLKRQQAQAVIEARAAIVEGAIQLVDNAVRSLHDRKIVSLDDREKAALVTSMLTVLLSDEGASPVLNVGQRPGGS